MRPITASIGMRMSAPIIGGPSADLNFSVKSLDHLTGLCNDGQVVLPSQEARMDSATANTIRLGPISVDFLVEPGDSNGSVTVFECVVPADAKVPIPHSHDGFEETIYGLEGVSTWT